MKKMMMIVAIGMVAMGMQAAQVAWSIAGNTFGKSPDDASGNARAKYYTVLIFAAGDQTSVLAKIGAGDIVGAQAFSRSSGTTTATGATSGDFAVTGETYDMFFVAFDTWGTTGPSNLADAQNYLVSSTLTATSFESPSPMNEDGAWTAANRGAGVWTPVPEPTSMALLALGVAAVGLRRRFRK